MIIYYTGTGNSRFIAEAAADFLADEVTDARPYIKTHKAGSFASTTPYVFCSPTYAWRLPLVFSHFIEESHFSGSKDGKEYLVQAAYSIAAESTYEREFSLFNSLDQSRKKMIITNDDVDYSTSTVEHIKLKNFLLMNSLDK